MKIYLASLKNFQELHLSRYLSVMMIQKRVFPQKRENQGQTMTITIANNQPTTDISCFEFQL